VVRSRLTIVDSWIAKVFGPDEVVMLGVLVESIRLRKWFRPKGEKTPTQRQFPNRERKRTGDLETNRN
jgi:hypothetical protein